jgi:polysaccharide deacetylase family protein (PEP-CTERM system associated)
MAEAGTGPRIPLSIDWEDWFQFCFAPYDQPEALDRYECRLPLATEKTLQLCEDLGAKATWFCLADQACRHPALLRLILARGHKIGLHGLTHRRITALARGQFRAEVEEGRKVLEDLAGCAVEGFRAPEWSLRGPAEAFWEEIRDAGFRYDSSRAPLLSLGASNRPRIMHQLAEGFWECPPPVAGIGLASVPLWGWGMRVLPEAWLKGRVRRLSMRETGTPLVLHPWELDEHQPKAPGCSLGHRFAHRAGLRGYGGRLRRILKGENLVTIETFLGLSS